MTVAPSPQENTDPPDRHALMGMAGRCDAPGYRRGVGPIVTDEAKVNLDKTPHASPWVVMRVAEAVAASTHRSGGRSTPGALPCPTPRAG